MSTTTWADIQRLAADLQRVQLAESSKRLTDANCVEVVSILMARGLVDLVVSTDGKEYITRRHLQTECANECLATGGRIALTELASQLNVDLDHVNTAVGQLLKGHQQQAGEGRGVAEFVVCAGELLQRDFINDLCARLDARLQELGHISMLQLTRQWELPTELLNQHILPELGTQPGARISAIRFEDQLCTIRYIGALRAALRALLIALTKPTPVANIHAQLAISQPLFFKLWNELGEEGKLPGKLLGGKNSLKSLYVPDVHERMAKQYVKQRLAEDHFIESTTLKRLSIAADPASFFRDLLPQSEFADLLFWPSAVLSESRLWRECDSLARNLLQSAHFCLLEDILPAQLLSFLTDEDYGQVVERLQQNCNGGTNLRSTEDRTVLFEHPQLAQSWLKAIDAFVGERTAKDAPELRKAQLNAALAKQKGGGGGGRGAAEKMANKEREKGGADDSWEMDKPNRKGKGGKKGGQTAPSGSGKGKKGGGAPSADDPTAADPLSMAQLPPEELFAQLLAKFPAGFEIPAALRAELADDFVTEANRAYRRGLAEAWQQMADQGEEQQETRRAYEARMAKIGEAYIAICQFEKGAEAFEESMCNDLHAYLLRSLCTELAQSMLLALADPTSSQQPFSSSSSAPSPPISAKQREQLISAALDSAEMQKRTRTLFDSLAESMQKFHEALGRLANLAGVMLKQPDKKERADHFASLGTELRDQLANCADPPTFLLLAVLLSLHRYHGLAIHASGKFVSPLIAFLSTTKPASSSSQAGGLTFPTELSALLNETQRLVVTSIKQKGATNGQQQQQGGQNELAAKIAQLKGAFFAAEEEEEGIKEEQ